MEASDFCKLVNATLPVVRSRSELLEILSLIKISPHIPDLFAIFLGMRREHKVSTDLKKFTFHGVALFWETFQQILMFQAGKKKVAKFRSSYLSRVVK